MFCHELAIHRASQGSFLTTLFWQASCQFGKVLEIWTCQNSKKLAESFFWIFPFRFVGKFLESEICHFIFSFTILANSANAKLYKSDHPTTPDARLALTSVLAGGTVDTRCHWQQL